MPAKYLENGLRQMLLARETEIQFTLFDEGAAFFKSLVQNDISICSIIENYEIRELEPGTFRVTVFYRKETLNPNKQIKPIHPSKTEYNESEMNEESPLRKEYSISSFDELSSAFYDAADLALEEMVLISPKSFNLEKHFHWFWGTRSSQIPTMISAGGSIIRDPDKTTMILHPQYRLGRFMRLNNRKTLLREVDRLASQMFLPDMPTEAKVLLAHNYLCVSAIWLKNHDNRVEYQYTQGPYGVLIKKRGVCQSFSTAFQMIMERERIPCFVICGKTAPFDTEKSGHAWNIVCINGEYYHIDCTWDANKHKPKYEYFCVPDSYLDNKRRWDYAAWPACNGKADIQPVAISFIKAHKEQLLKNGVDPRILDC